MKLEADNEELLTRYLLGELSEEEQQQVEQQYIDDEEFYDHLLIVEDDLIDSYARGEMPESERDRFESYFLRSPERVKRVEFARSLEALTAGKLQKDNESKQIVQTKRPAGFFNIARWPVALRFLAAAVLIGLGVWVAYNFVSLSSRAERAESEKAALEQRREELERQAADERRRNEELSAQLEEERNLVVEETPEQATPEQATRKVASILLSPGMVRGGSGARGLFLEPGNEQVRLTLSFSRADYKSYRAVIQTVEEREIFSRAGLKSTARGETKSVTVTLPASLLSTRDYIVTLSGLTDEGAMEPVAEYSLPVTKK